MKLTVDNIQMILDTLIYDGKAEVQMSIQQNSGEVSDLQRLYRVTRTILDSVESHVGCVLLSTSAVMVG